MLQQQTTGAGDDLEKATEMARKMVCEWGMSEKLGPLTFGKNEEHIFLGREVARQQDYSEETAVLIDAEVKRIVLDCAARRHAPSSRRTATSSTAWPRRSSSTSRSTPRRSRVSSPSSRTARSKAPRRSSRTARAPRPAGGRGPAALGGPAVRLRMRGVEFAWVREPAPEPSSWGSST